MKKIKCDPENLTRSKKSNFTEGLQNKFIPYSQLKIEEDGHYWKITYPK